MNEIKADVIMWPKFIELSYWYNGHTYVIQLPKTQNNVHLKDGDEVLVGLGIISHTLEKDTEDYENK